MTENTGWLVFGTASDPLTGTIGNWSIIQEGRVKQPGENPNGDWQVVTPGYFESMGIRLLRGRTFADTDDQNAPIVAVISEAMAERYWPNQDAIGKRFRIGGPAVPWISVVGIAGAVRHNALTERPRTEMYVPYAQWGAAGASTRRAMTFVIRTARDPVGVLPHVREAVRSIRRCLCPRYVPSIKSPATLCRRLVLLPHFFVCSPDWRSCLRRSGSTA